MSAAVKYVMYLPLTKCNSGAHILPLAHTGQLVDLISQPRGLQLTKSKAGQTPLTPSSTGLEVLTFREMNGKDVGPECGIVSSGDHGPARAVLQPHHAGVGGVVAPQQGVLVELGAISDLFGGSRQWQSLYIPLITEHYV